jgi:hypothetical protein
MVISRVFYIHPEKSTTPTYVKASKANKTKEKEGDLCSNQFKHATGIIAQGVINDLGDLGPNVTCCKGTTKNIAACSALAVSAPAKYGRPQRPVLCVRSLTSSLEWANTTPPSMRYVTFKIGGFGRHAAQMEKHNTIINYLYAILKHDTDPAVSAFGRREHVNVRYIAKLIKAILLAMLQYNPATRTRPSTGRRWNDDGPVVIEPGVGYADEVDKAHLAAELKRIGTRIYLLTKYQFKLQRDPTPTAIKTAAWDLQLHDDGTVGCFYLRAACTPDIQAACRLMCRGVDAHLRRDQVEYAHLWAMWHQLHSGFWDKVRVRGVRFLGLTFCFVVFLFACMLSGSTV